MLIEEKENMSDIKEFIDFVENHEDKEDFWLISKALNEHPDLTEEKTRILLDERRWYNVFMDVFVTSSGEFIGFTYNEGSTEMQEDTDPEIEVVSVESYIETNFKIKEF